MEKDDYLHAIVSARIIHILLNCLFDELLNIVINDLCNFKTKHYRYNSFFLKCNNYLFENIKKQFLKVKN